MEELAVKSTLTIKPILHHHHSRTFFKATL